MPRKESIVSVANRVVPFPVAARWAGVHSGGTGGKTYCPFPFEHDDGGQEQAFRVYPDHGYCFAEQRYFTVTGLLSLTWDVSGDDAAARALRDVGWRPAGYAHLWADAEREPEPDREALRAALEVWCSGQCADWAARQYESGAAGKLARCFGLLPLVHTPGECCQWLAACKRAMAPHLS